LSSSGAALDASDVASPANVAPMARIYIMRDGGPH